MQLAICWKNRSIHLVLPSCPLSLGDSGHESSDNPMAGGMTRATPENQQETARTVGSSEAIRQPSRTSCEMKRWSDPYGDVGRPLTSDPLIVEPTPTTKSHKATAISEIPCRVSNDLPLERAISPANPANNGEPLPRTSGESRGKSRAARAL